MFMIRLLLMAGQSSGKIMMIIYPYQNGKHASD